MSKLKIIATGHVIEIWQYEHEPYIAEKKKVDGLTNYLLTGDETYLEREDKPDWLRELEKKHKQRSNGRTSRHNFRRLVTMNFEENKSTFITLTFSDVDKEGLPINVNARHTIRGAPIGEPIDIRSIKDCNKAFDNFMKRLRRKYGKDFKFAVVVEFQDKNNRGAVHYHMIADLKLNWKNDAECRRLEREFAEEVWLHGYVDLKSIDHVDNVGAYLSKYMVKRMDDERLAGKKAYRVSQNLDRPLILKDDEAEALIKLYNLEKIKEISANSYESEYLGQIVYKQYNLKRAEKTTEDVGNTIPF